jgi:hypothetical protein
MILCPRKSWSRFTCGRRRSKKRRCREGWYEGLRFAEFKNASLRALTRLRHPLPLPRARAGRIAD